MEVINIKNNETFEYFGQFKDAAGAAPDLSGWSVASQVRRSNGALVESLIVAWVDVTTAQFHMKSAQISSTWPVEPLLCDLKLSDAEGRTISTDTFLIRVEKGQTL